MTRTHTGRTIVLLALALGCGATAVRAEDFHYNYVSLDAVPLPPGIDYFEPDALTNGGRLYGTAYDFVNFIPYVAYYEDGEVTLLQPGFAYSASQSGTVGGSVLLDIDPDTFEYTSQAAIFRGDEIELLPPLPGEVNSAVGLITDSGLALVSSTNAFFQTTFYVYDEATGKANLLPGIGEDDVIWGINEKGTISGSTFFPGGDRAFRYDPKTGEKTLLAPLPTEPDSWGLGINNRGSVVGYSFVAGGLERIGVWDQRGQFKTYFVEGTPQFPTVSNRLLVNDNDLIVITLTAGADRNSYLVPKPGVRLNLADVVEGAPQRRGALNYILDVNNAGDMFGYGLGGSAFYLKRVGVGGE